MKLLFCARFTHSQIRVRLALVVEASYPQRRAALDCCDIRFSGGFVMRLLAQIVVALSLCTVSLMPARAEEPLVSAQQVITSQIQAFLSDDADTAYGFASPQIRALFPDKERFFAMVKKSYQPVYRPGNFAFGRFKVSDDTQTVLQEVLVTGGEGADWTAVYELRRQPDGQYKINGVQLLPNTTSKGI